jgi:hypothetical protein
LAGPAFKVQAFGQPLTGRFFWKDLLIAACQPPFSFSISGFVPRFIGGRFVAAFIAVTI